MRAVRDRLAESLRAFREVFTNPNLRRVQLAWVGSETGKWLYLIALLVYAYDAGGASGVGLVAVIRTVPTAIVAPFAALLADRYRRERVMLAATLIRLVTIAGAGVVIALDGPTLVVYGLAAFVTLVSTAFRPAQAALLPSLARTPEELTAANVASSTVASVGSFVGPAVGGLLLAATSIEVVFFATALTFLWTAAMVARIRPERDEAPAARAREPEGIVRESLAGFRTIAGDRNLRLLIGLYGAQAFVGGTLNVLIVVLALESLDLGEAGVGFLNSAFGIGGVLGTLVALALVARQRLASDFMFGIMLWGIPLALMGVWPNPAVAVLMLGLIGVGETVVEVAGPTLLQRSVPQEVLARVFGALESMLVATIGLGGVVAPLLVVALGVRGALLASGAILPILALFFWRRLTAMDRAAPARDRVPLLQAIPMFALLPPAAVEQLASSLVPTTITARADVVRQGDAGDRFYIVEDGELEVRVDGEVVRTLGPGDYFGEIALLRDVPRTATVRAVTDARLVALDRDEFIAAVTGHSPSREAADAVISSRLGSLRTGLASN